MDKTHDATHVKQRVTVKNSALFQRTNFSANTARKRDSTILTDIVRDNSIKLRRTKLRKQMNDPTQRKERSQMLFKSLVNEILLQLELVKRMTLETTVIAHISSTQEVRMKKN